MRRRDQGNASLEFIGIAVLLMVPLAYGIVAFAQLQSAVYGVSGAAQMASRAFVQSGSELVGRYAAVRSAAIAGRNHGLIIDSTNVTISCGEAECLVPGRAVTVTVQLSRRIGFAGVTRTIPLRASHTAIVDEFRAVPS